MNGIKSGKTLQEFQKIIENDIETAEFGSGELKWIQDRKRSWESDKIRVGVIGVTSSGKSTLINAILGQELLSSAVAPSSGQLVCCSWGERNEIHIYFENGKQETLSGVACSMTQLQQYSDERYNPHNQKGVLNIELCSPQYDLGKDVLLIDSPGLDAFGLEEHEKLTLESLVPTIDACIYVTTMKTNSDLKTKEILDTVAKYRCPLIIIQNMLDSVQPSISGDKSSRQVAQEHWKRVKRIVDQSNIEEKNSVQIVQISAEWAKRWRAAKTAKSKPTVTEEQYKESNYAIFVKTVQDALEVQRPRIERQRCLSVREKARDLQQSVTSKLSGAIMKAESSFPLSGLERETNTHLGKMGDKAKKIVDKFNADKQSVEENLNALSKPHSWNESLNNIFFSASTKSKTLDEILTDTNTAVNNCAKELTKLISDHNDFTQRAANLLHIPERDLTCSTKLSSFSTEVTKQTRYEVVDYKWTEEVEGSFKLLKKGWNKLTGSHWKQKQEPIMGYVTDKERTIEKVRTRLDEAAKKYRTFFESWHDKDFVPSMNRIIAEIQKEKEGFERRKAAVVRADKLRSLSKELDKLIRKIENEVPNASFAATDGPKWSSPTESRRVTVTEYAVNLRELSLLMIQEEHRATTKALIRKMNCMDHTPVLISWDENSKKELLDRTGIKMESKNVFDSPKGRIVIPTLYKRCFFVLVNAIQVGAAKKQVSELRLDAIIQKDDCVVWVVQDFRELLVSEQVAEGLKQMLSFGKELGIFCNSCLYLLHENPVYNVALANFQFDTKLKQVSYQLIEELRRKYRYYLSEDVEKTIGQQIVKAF